MKQKNDDRIAYNKLIQDKVELGKKALKQRKQPLELEFDDKLDTDCNIRNRGKWKFGE